MEEDNDVDDIFTTEVEYRPIVGDKSLVLRLLLSLDDLDGDKIKCRLLFNDGDGDLIK